MYIDENITSLKVSLYHTSPFTGIPKRRQRQNYTHYTSVFAFVQKGITVKNIPITPDSKLGREKA